MRLLKKAACMLLAASVMVSSFSASAFAATTAAPSVTKADISTATIVAADATYTGAKQDAKITVTAADGKTVLVEGTDYVVVNKSYKNSGVHTITIIGCGRYEGKTTTAFTIVGKKKQAVKVTLKNNAKKTYKASTLKKKSKKVTLKVTKNKGTVTYKVTKGSKKYITVSKKGVVTLKKGIKKGTYKVTVYVGGKGTYNPVKKVITFKVK